MKFIELTPELAANKKGADIIVVYEAEDETYFMGSVITNQSLSEDEALNLIGWDDETMSDAVEKIGWDGYDYDAINVIWNPEEYLIEKGFLRKMKSYIQLAHIANAYYDIWTDDGIDAFHADADEIAAWLKREDLRTEADTELADLTDDEIAKIASMIADMVKDAMTEAEDE